MARSAIERLAGAIGYPDRMPEGALAATLRVDGVEVSAAVTADRIVLSLRLTDEDAPAGAGDQALVRLFESFMDSCDWGRARVEGPKAEGGAEFPEMMIRP